MLFSSCVITAHEPSHHTPWKKTIYLASDIWFSYSNQCSLVVNKMSVLGGQALPGSDHLVFFEKFLGCLWMDINTAWIFHFLTA